MTDTKHTPAPWVYEPGSEDDNEQDCFSVWVYDHGTGAEIAGRIGEEANARLIAAAPELLAACEAALVAATEHVPLHELVIRAEEVRKTLRAAIAKATGK